MISKKNTSIMMTAMVAIVAISALASGIAEPVYQIERSGHAQIADRTFEQRVAVDELVIVGTIVSSEIEMFEETVTGTDCDGCEVYVIEETVKPKQKITVKVMEVLKDDGVLNGEKFVTFYDSFVTGIGEVNGAPVKFISAESTEYHVGDKGIFIINEDPERLSMSGFVNYYPIEKGFSTVTSQFDKMTDKAPIDVENAKEIAKLVA